MSSLKPIALVSHDAGGAEMISSWALQNPGDYVCVAEGPALKIFKKKLAGKLFLTLDEALEICDSLICGTSWESDLERLATVRACSLGKHVALFFDHWTDYKARVLLNGQYTCPSEIWVADDYALKLARDCFDSIPIKIKGNPYLNEVEEEIKSIIALDNNKQFPTKGAVLYLGENVNSASIRYGNADWGYRDEDVVKFFLENICTVVNEVNSISIRPHPSEEKDKYEWVRESHPLVSSVSSSRSLPEDILEAEIVVGCQSMAMVVALMAKKTVISCIPPGGQNCSLPHKELLHLGDLLSKRNETLMWT